MRLQQNSIPTLVTVNFSCPSKEIKIQVVWEIVALLVIVPSPEKPLPLFLSASVYYHNYSYTCKFDNTPIGSMFSTKRGATSQESHLYFPIHIETLVLRSGMLLEQRPNNMPKHLELSSKKDNWGICWYAMTDSCEIWARKEQAKENLPTWRTHVASWVGCW